MSLDTEIEQARKEIASDGYDMSVGELLNLYRDGELIIHPEFQRLFRWEESQKTRFIESLLLGIPVPPIFVFQDQSGAWELIDGLQRLSTIFEFAGILKHRDGETTSADSPRLLGTNFLPDLAGRKWESTDSPDDQTIGKTAQLYIKRARIRIEILKKESDPIAKYELFQRLNTGGTTLSEQEVRNCTAIMINPEFQRWLIKRSEFSPFQQTTAQTEDALKKQAGVELALRFFVFRNVKYEPGLDVHEYLDKALIKIASDKTFPLESECANFEKTFSLLNNALGENAFKRWNGDRFTGKFLMSLFEVTAIGVSENIDEIQKLGPATADFVQDRSKSLWQDSIFGQNSGAGVRGTTRLAKLLPMAGAYFKP